ncbi:hypothetical protein UFOVP917_52 [uncultured Caudovirales phage]|uniref:Holin of 3TMs, for gene-transfer release n=1 Tax=uncultured Caudovirales phage TaxID=2100421 RepID=A0A6J5QI12_9CAUD|nr:hypothetical protein UFOVP297_30 [uncultured Caudovirales phage]CAB4171361.1 hypothetical protein UFOVP917_52 [uncultured Caudovirales phage]CAB4183332.1 hypothetical protein UFOVP1094_54 [uncultured Caudovirales phage]CAB4200671.1 hypothetical protein UFOVP1342_54 [uncultured Caudovirales phage]CAB4213357.1 hypothetical protein UFOVP1450_3 [uncultured Caudovirales phage]
MDWIKSILPTIGGLLGGPLGSAAVTAAADALGLSDKSKDAVERALSGGNLTAEQMVALKQADAQFKLKMEELGIKTEELAVADRASARQMQIATGSLVPHIIAILFIGIYLAMMCLLLTGTMKLWEDATLTMLLGGLTSGVAMILGYYFGAAHTQINAKK